MTERQYTYILARDHRRRVGWGGGCSPAPVGYFKWQESSAPLEETGPGKSEGDM